MIYDVGANVAAMYSVNESCTKIARRVISLINMFALFAIDAVIILFECKYIMLYFMFC